MGIFNNSTVEQITVMKAISGAVVSIVVGTFLAHEWLFGTFYTTVMADEKLATKKDIVQIQKSIKSMNRSIQYQRLGIIRGTIQHSKNKLSSSKDKDEKVFIKGNILILQSEKAELETSLGLQHEF